MLANKAAFALGGGLAFFIAGWYGFNPSEQIHSSEAIAGLQLAAIWLPAVIACVAILFIIKIPLTVKHQDLIRHRIHRRSSFVSSEREHLKNMVEGRALADLKGATNPVTS